MRKSLLFVGAMVWGLSVGAQTLPNPVYTLDFEGVASAADLNAEQVGAGEFRQSSDENFGTYYQNNPEGVIGSHLNYLIVPTQAFINCQSKNNEQFSIGFWLNGYVANEKQGVNADGHYYSTAIAAYSQVNSYKTFSWPMFSVRTRRTLQINCNGWSDYTAAESVTGSVVESNEWIWTKQVESGEIDDEGNPVMVPTDFDANWHYVTITFSGLNAKYYVDGVVMNEWNATANNYYFVSVMNALDALYLGDCGPFWQDKDGAYAYDDIAFYATELTQDQIELIMDIKRGTLSEEDKIIVARGQLDLAKSELEDYAAQLGDAFQTIGSDVSDWLIDEIGDSNDYENIEVINAAIIRIQDKQNAITAVVNAHASAARLIAYYTDYCNNTNYAAADVFQEALTTATATINDPVSVETIDEALQTLEAAKVAYVFSQEGEVIDVTRVINDPWFVDETYEPTLNEEGNLTFPDEAANHLSKEGWTLSFSENLRGNTDCTIYFTNGRSTANLWHNSTVSGGVLDVQQTLSGLPAGYYELSADMSSSSAPTDNRIYATSGGVTKVSTTPSSLGSWVSGADTSGEWVTLTADKVLVGEDGTLTIGATATTDGTQYTGWFCVTNFQLKYYGTEYDMSADVQDKTAEVAAAIETLTLKGDVANATASMNAITESEATDYEKVSRLTDLLAEVNDIYAQEDAFTALDDLQTQRNATDDETLQTIYATAIADITATLTADATTVDALPALTALYAAYVAYAETAAAAKAWGAEGVTSELNAQVAALGGATDERLAENQTRLISAMKASIVGFDASESNPKDITGLVGNASFVGDQHSAWTIDGTYAVQQAEIEFYNNSFNLRQTLTDMPKGTYRLMASGFYRDGNDYAAIRQNYLDGTYLDHAHMQLYVQSASFSVSAPFASIASDSLSVGSEEDDGYYDYYGNQNHVATDFTTLDTTADPVVFYPYWMWNAYDMITNRGLYSGNALTFVIDDETADITIGVEKETTIPYDWAIIDNVRLYYLGQDIPVAIAGTDSPTASVPVATYTVGGLPTATLQRGLNIVKMSDNTVKKVLVK